VGLTVLRLIVSSSPISLLVLPRAAASRTCSSRAVSGSTGSGGLGRERLSAKEDSSLAAEREEISEQLADTTNRLEIGRDFLPGGPGPAARPAGLLPTGRDELEAGDEQDRVHEVVRRRRGNLQARVGRAGTRPSGGRAHRLSPGPNASGASQDRPKRQQPRPGGRGCMVGIDRSGPACPVPCGSGFK
jgi:hypothetical protein